MKTLALALLFTTAIAARPALAHEGHDHGHGKKSTPVNAGARDKTFSAFSGDAASWIKTGHALMQKSRETIDPHLYDQAEKAYERALAIDADNSEALAGMAWVHNSRHEFADGMEWARKAIAAGSKDHMPHSLLGDAEMELGNYEEALEHFQNGLDRSPNLSTYSRAAHLLWLTGDAVKARLLMQKAIEAGGPHPENAAWCRAELALMLFNTGALLGAESEINKAFELAPDNHHVLYVKGRIRVAQGRHDEAVQILRASAEKAPGHAGHEPLVGLGDLLAEMGQKEEAEKVYAQVVAIHTGHSHSHEDGPAHSHGDGDGNAQLARFYADHDRNLPEAVREAELAFKTYKNVGTMTALAWAFYKTGRYPEAQKMIRKALAIRTPDAAIYFRAGMIAAKLEDRPVAQKYLSQALSMNPHFHPAEAKLAARTIKELSAHQASAKAVANVN